MEAGWRAEYEIRDGVKFTTNGYYREYFEYSDYVPTDLRRDLSAVVRLDTNLWGNLTMGPYVKYRLAKARGADVYGSNFMMGVSFNYQITFQAIAPTRDAKIFWFLDDEIIGTWLVSRRPQYRPDCNSACMGAGCCGECQRAQTCP